jgi:Natural resistance-associated macrophage protein
VKAAAAPQISPVENARRFFRTLGPGPITGAADDDPSGISTYPAAGATTGFSMLWLTLISTPMMAVFQGMCAHIAMFAGEGLCCGDAQATPANACLRAGRPRHCRQHVQPRCGSRRTVALMGAATVGMFYFMARGS